MAGRSHGTWDIEITNIGAAVGDLVARALVDGEDLGGESRIAGLGRLITPHNAHTYRALDTAGSVYAAARRPGSVGAASRDSLNT